MLGVLMCILVLAACGQGPGNQDTNPPRWTWIAVAGEVVSQTKRPVPGATVEIRWGEVEDGAAGCDLAADTTVITSASGEFRAVIQSGPQNVQAFIVIAVAPPLGAPLRATSVRAPDVRFRTISPGTEPPESYVRVLLPSNAAADGIGRGLLPCGLRAD